MQPDVWESFFATHRVGDVVHGKILRTAQFGAFVEIAEGVEGLCHISEAGDPVDGHSPLEQGLENDFKIIKINVEEKKVGFSLRTGAVRKPNTRPAKAPVPGRTPGRISPTSRQSPVPPPRSATWSTGEGRALTLSLCIGHPGARGFIPECGDRPGNSGL